MWLLPLSLSALAAPGAFDCTAWSAPADAWEAMSAMDLDDTVYGYTPETGVLTEPFDDVLAVLYTYSEPGCPYYNDGGDIYDVTVQSVSDTCTTTAGDSISWTRRPESGSSDERLGTWSVTIVPASGALTSLTLSSTATGEWQSNHDAPSSFVVDTWSWEASWTGELGGDYPADGWMALEARPRSSSDYLDGSWSYTLDLAWASSSCDWSLAFSQAYDVGTWTTWDLVQGTQSLVVEGEEGLTCDEESAEATLDGVTSTIAVDGWTSLTDLDADGYCAERDDCHDLAARIHPGARDLPYDGLDQDCDGGDLVDVDGDGHAAIAAGGDDCVDRNARVYPGAPDRRGDGLDQDCNGRDGA